MRTRLPVLLLLVGAACAPAASGEREAAVPQAERPLLVVTAGGALGTDPSSGGETFSFAHAVVAPWGGAVVAARQVLGETYVSTHDPETGGMVETLGALAGSYEPVVASRSGAAAALVPAGDLGPTLYTPVPRARSEVVVAKDGEARIYDLAGNFVPEAFSTDGARLYLIEHLPAMAPTRYRVRILELASGSVHPIGRLKLAAPDQMNGTGRTQVYAPDGTALYTLYTRQPHNDTPGHPDAPRERGMVHAFVHQLNLEDGWAHCIDLPMPFGSRDAESHAIAVSPDGILLYVVDPSTGTVALIRPGAQKVDSTARVAMALDGDVAAVVDRDGNLHLTDGSELIVIDRALKERARHALNAEVSDLTFSEDQSRIYAATGSEVLVLDVSTGSVIGSIDAPGALGVEVPVP